MADEKIGEAYIEIGAERERGEPKRTLREIRSALEKEDDLKVPTDIDHSELITDLRDAIDQAEKAADEIELETGLDTALVRARLARLTRPRFVTIFSRLNNASVLAVAKSLAMLSGARLVGHYFDNMFDSIKRLDKSIPTIAGLSSAIGGLSAAAIAAVGSVFSIGAELAGAALVLPAILGATAVGVGGLVMAFQDAGKVLGDLGPKLAEIQDSLSSKFWAKAEKPIRDLADKALPMLNKRFGETGDALGGVVGRMADVIGSSKNMSMLDTMFRNINKAIGISKDGVGDFTDALLTLSGEGSKYLPRMSQWFNKLGADFKNWIDKAAADGRLHEWIENGITALKDLGSIIGSTLGILAGFSKAVLEAGGPTLGNLADGLEKVNDAINGPLWQGAITDVFRGANKGVANMGRGVRELGDAFLNISGVIEDVLGKAGEAASGFMELVADIVQHPAFTSGLTGFFDGIIKGIDGVKKGSEGFAQVFGSMMQFAGDLAAVIGPVLGAAFDALGPILQDVFAALTPVAEVLGGWLMTAIQAIEPYIRDVVSAISDWVQANPELAAVLGILAGIIGAVISALIGIVSAIAPVVAAVWPMVSSLVAAAGGWSAIAGAVGAALGPIAAVIGIIAAVGAAVIYAWNTSERFRDAVMGLGDAIVGYFKPVVGFVQTYVVPMFQTIGEAVMGALKTIGDALSPLLAVVIEIVTAIIERMTPIVGFLLGVLGPAFTFIGEVISGVFKFIGDVIGAAIDVITAILETFLALLKGDWQGVWEGFGNIVQTVWDLILTIISGAVEQVIGHVVAFGTMIEEIFANIWMSVSGWVMNLATSVITWFSSMVTGAVNWVVNLATSVGTWFSNLYNTVFGWVTNLVSTVVSWFGQLPVQVGSSVSNLVSSVVNFFSNLYSNVSSRVSALVDAVVARFLNLRAKVISTVMNLASQAVNAFNNMKARVSAVVQGLVAATISKFVQMRARISSAVQSARQAVVNAFNGIRSGVSSAMSAVASAVSSGVNRVVSLFRSMGSRAVSAVRGFVGSMRSVGTSLIQGLMGGIRSMAGRVASAARGVVSGAVSAAKRALKISSPSRVFMEFGEFTGEGYAIGLEKMTKPVTDAMNRMLPNSRTVALRADTSGLVLPSGGLAARSTALAGTGGMVIQGPLVALNGPVTLDSDDRVRQLAESLWTRAHRTDRAQGKINLGGVVR